MLKSVRCIVALAVLALVGFSPLAMRAVEPGKPAVTALETTAYRAIGAKHSDPKIRNDDYLAERFLGTEERAILRAEGSQTVLDALELDTVAAWKSLGPGIAFATAVHARTRHIDDVFKESLAAGATQVVILGAGLDSRAYRFGDALKGARVFEVDFPPTQEYKKKRVQEILNGLPPHVAYVPIDFTKGRSRHSSQASRLRHHEEDSVRIGRRDILYSRGRREWNVGLRRFELRSRQSNCVRLLPGERSQVPQHRCSE